MLLMSSCAFQDKDDILPVPVVSTPYLQSGTVGIVNEVARSVKRVELNVEIIENMNCISSYSHSQLRFELGLPGGPSSSLIKVVEPVKRTMQFIERLEDNRKYVARLVFTSNEQVLTAQTFHASQNDSRILFKLPCRA